MENLVKITQLLANLSEFAIIYYAYLSLSEMRKQREESHHPEVFLGNQVFYALGTINSQISIPYLISSELKNREHYHDNLNDLIFLRIYNVGTSPAKGLHIEWEFNLKEAIDLIKRSNYVGFFILEPTTRGYTLTTKGGTTTHTVGSNLFDDRFDYILPSNNEKIEIMIPGVYLELYLIYQMCGFGLFATESKHEPEPKPSFYIDHFPTLYAKLKFEDLHGKIFHKKIKVSISGFVDRINGFPKWNENLGQFFIKSSEVTN